MSVNVSQIDRLFGDRILVEKFGRPAKIGAFYLPENHKDNHDRKSIWWGKIHRFGLDSRAQDAFELKEGDLVGLDPLAMDCTTLTDESGAQFVWVPDEFIAAKDDGTMAELYARN